jgi:excisionase family DNA binding protein
MTHEKESPAAYVTVRQAQALLGVSRDVIAKLLREGTLPWERNPLDTRSKLIKRSDVDALAAKRPQPGPSGQES